MTSPEEKGASLVEASSGERPFSQEALKEDDTRSTRMKWTKRKSIWIKDTTWQGKESGTKDPDLFPILEKEPDVKRRMNWTHENGIWTRSTEQDPDILTNLPEQDPDIVAKPPEQKK